MTKFQEINAVGTEALQTRIRSQSNQKIDINTWIGDNLVIDKKNRVLELCCGTGAQTKIFSQRISGGEIICTDLNQDSLEVNKANVGNADIKYVAANLDQLANHLSGKFDLIFCAYGFYYSAHPYSLLHQLYDFLGENGRFVLVGPVLGNNTQLYGLLEKIGIKISATVTESSETFMLDMQREFLAIFENIKFLRIKNTIPFGTAQSLFEYWKKTTFFEEGFEQQFLDNADNFFDQSFTLTKSIGFLEGSK